ncbi:MAG: response regulator [Elusimicrobia bacterium]|nr:response regulator [Elusimicrobiota bacterium]
MAAARRKRDILVVDDEPSITGSVDRICGCESLSVDKADSAEAGFGLLDSAVYRLILCDIRMAGADGFAFLLHAAKTRVATPVVMITGYATVHNAVRSMFSGAIDFIAKPFTADELLAVVRRGLRYDELRRQAAEGAANCAPYPRRCRRLGHVSWAVMEKEGTALVGVCDPFLKTLGGVAGVALGPAGGELVQGGRGAEFRSQDGLLHGMMSPLSGRIVETNAAAEPAALAKDPYGKGWLYRIMPSDPGPELEQLVISGADSL